jgi:hypothetical protein
VLLPLLLQLLLLEPSVSATWVAQILMRVSQMAHDTFVQIVNLGQLNFFWARSKAGILLACISNSWDSDLDAMLTSNGQSRLGSGLSWATPTTPPLSTLGRKEYIRKHSWDQRSPIHNYSQNQQLRWNRCFRKSQSMAKHGKAMQSACDLSGPVRTCQESCRKVDGNCVRLLVKDWRLDLSRWVTILALNHWIGKSMESTSSEQRNKVRSLWQSRCKKGTSNMDQKAGRLYCLYSICSRSEVILVNWSPWFGFALHWGVKV